MAMKLTKDMLKVLEEREFIATMCTATKDGIPSGRPVGIVPSDDLTKIYVGNSRFNKAERDIKENKNVMFVFWDSQEDPYEIKSFQVACKLIETIEDKESSIFQRLYRQFTKCVDEEEANRLKCVYGFEIEQIYGCLQEGGGKPITS